MTSGWGLGYQALFSLFEIGGWDTHGFRLMGGVIRSKSARCLDMSSLTAVGSCGCMRVFMRELKSLSLVLVASVGKLGSLAIETYEIKKGVQTHQTETSLSKDDKDQYQFGKKEKMFEIMKESPPIISDALTPAITGNNLVAPLDKETYSSMGPVDSISGPIDLSLKLHSSERGSDVTVAFLCDNSKFPLLTKHRDSNSVTSRGTGFDLNVDAIDLSNSEDHDPFFPCKTYGHVKSGEASECGSSSGPLEENGPFKRWQEMKRNGFLSSSSHGGIPVPKKRGRKSKSKNDVMKEKMEIAKKEQVARFSKIAAPSGLLNGLNPGIINHVRNSKQVHSIIEAMVRSEKLENKTKCKSSSQSKGDHKETNHKQKDLEDTHDSIISRISQSHGDKHPSTLAGSTIVSSSSKQIDRVCDLIVGDRRVWDDNSVASQFTSDHDDDTFTLKLSSSTCIASENTNSLYNDDSINKASVPSLSIKASTVASQWLELLDQDIKGRLSALKRSKKRVQAVIQTELPLLVSRELSPNPQNDTDTATAEVHLEKWNALFSQMEKTLSEEGRHLESWLKQVKEMQLHCEWGLQSVNWNGLQQLGKSQNISGSTGADKSEKEIAIRAAAASIYSTCNLVLSKANAPNF
ncbi:hypothetical protein GIB67_026566 [Kingdonia uniflora]|uniref:Uncharacterized protein n=1 Tax=Kingdonia uniflora TaxID=39325 RepID=A0A7J7NNS1_9MAGN|nr:hypothetical protein GIB67_026566 [Kingdonia uniflora]